MTRSGDDTTPAEVPKAAALAEAPVFWAQATSTATPAPTLAASPENRVLFHSWILRRNFAGFPFWVSASPETCAHILERASAHAKRRGFGGGWPLAALAALEPALIGVLRERMRLPERPASFPGKRHFKMLFTREAENNTGRFAEEHALLGETEHWTRIRTEPGAPSAENPPDFLRCEGRDGFDEGLEEGFQGGPLFSRSPDWGLLASDPAHAGVGLQCEAGVHLPALTAARKIPQIRQAMAAMGLELRPLSLRDPGAAEAGYFRLLTHGGMDLSSEALHARFAGKLKSLLGAETGAWEQWNARDRNLLDDRMHRALRLLQEARRMEYAELLFLTSFARAGVYKGIFADSLLPKLETLRVRSQPAHLAAASSGADPLALEPERDEESNARRAELGRSILSDA